MDKVIHFEIPVDDMKRAEGFYKKVFGWNVEFVPEMNYILLRTTEIDEDKMPKEAGAINGGMIKRNDTIKNPVITINVENIKKALENIKKNGGNVVMEPFQVGDMGLAAYFKDTEGNVLGIWQNLK